MGLAPIASEKGRVAALGAGGRGFRSPVMRDFEITLPYK